MHDFYSNKYRCFIEAWVGTALPVPHVGVTHVIAVAHQGPATGFDVFPGRSRVLSGSFIFTTSVGIAPTFRLMETNAAAMRVGCCAAASARVGLQSPCYPLP